MSRVSANLRVQQQTKQAPDANEPIVDLDKLEAIEMELTRDLINIEKDIYITEA